MSAKVLNIQSISNKSKYITKRIILLINLRAIWFSVYKKFAKLSISLLLNVLMSLIQSKAQNEAF